MEEKSALEKYLSGEPVNDELRELMSSTRREEGAPAAADPVDDDEPVDDIKRDLTRAERLALKELCAAKGWAVHGRILKRALQIHRDTAIAKSQKNPLENAGLISKEWAYVVIYKTLMRDLALQVAAELKMLETEKR